MGKITVEVKINTFGTMTHPKYLTYCTYTTSYRNCIPMG